MLFRSVSQSRYFGVVRATHGFCEYYANSLSVSSGVDTRLTTFTVSGTDTTGLDYTNGIWTNNTGRTVQVIMSIQSAWSANGTGARIHWAQLNATGATNAVRYLMVDGAATVGGEATVAITSAPIQLTNGSNVSVWLYQTSGGALTYGGGTAGMAANASSRVSMVVL